MVRHRLGGIELLLLRIGHVVRADDVDRSGGDSLPESVLIALFTKRRLADIESAVLSLEALPRKMQVDGTGFDIDRQPARLGLLRDTERPFGGQMHDINRCSCRLRHRYRASGRDDLSQDGTAIGKVAERAMAFLHQSLGGSREDRVVLAMDHGENSGFTGCVQRRQVAPGVLIECGTVHEHLDARLTELRE